MNALAAKLSERLRPIAAELVIAAAALALAWTFAATVLNATEFGLPFDDSYIYLTYAKQFGRGEPFSYFPGGGYSAGSTSVLWPMLLAPFWTLGARGHALVWVSFAMCAALYAATCVACYRLARELFGVVAGVAAAVLALGIAPFAFTSLSGMEVAFASALLLVTIVMLARASAEHRPSLRLVLCLAATSLSRPEAMMIVAGVVGVRVLQRVRARQWRVAARWASPLAAPAAWLLANKLLAGHLMPNTGVAKSHFYLPGFDWTYWWTAVATQTGAMLRVLWWDDASPLGVAEADGGRLDGRRGAGRDVGEGASNAGSPACSSSAPAPALVLSVIASSGAWSFHDYRYIAPAFPLLATVAGCAFAPPRRLKSGQPGAWIGGVAIALAAHAYAAIPAMRDDVMLYTQTVVDLNHQVVTIGRYLRDRLPDASIMFHDAGAVAYYGDTPVFDMLGLVTNHQTDVANNGPGSRFEFLESLPPERRPTHFSYYPAWMGQGEFFGKVLLATPLGPQFAKRRLVGDSDMQLIEASWDHVHTAERPLDEPPGWHVVDRVDVADLDSERGHAWRGALGRRNFADPTARWSVVHREVGPRGLLLDGGRTIRGGEESFAISVEPGKPVKLIMRSGGDVQYNYNESITSAVPVRVATAAGEARGTIPRPHGRPARRADVRPARRAPRPSWP